MKVPGFSEVSGVCTHPDAQGQGYGSALFRFVSSLIVNRGEIPFLHAYANNKVAIQLYRKLGFETRCAMVVQCVRRLA